MGRKLGEKMEYTPFPEWRSVKSLEGITARLAKYEYYLSCTFQHFQTWYMTVKILHGNPSISSLSRK